jgi:hypothetical protein
MYYSKLALQGAVPGELFIYRNKLFYRELLLGRQPLRGSLLQYIKSSLRDSLLRYVKSFLGGGAKARQLLAGRLGCLRQLKG